MRTERRPLIVLAALAALAACGDDAEGEDGGDTRSLVVRQVELHRAQTSIECACAASECGSGMTTALELECYQAFAEKYAEEVRPELQCEVQRLAAQNACLDRLACDDLAAWDACYDDREDCDDAFSESHDDEVKACLRQGGPGGSAGSGGAGGAGSAQAGSGETSAECTRDADCGVCRSSAERGCCQCPFVSPQDVCDAVEASQCAAVDCAIRECPEAGTPKCEAGRCVSARASTSG
jgi:hypothetical protein